MIAAVRVRWGTFKFYLSWLLRSMFFHSNCTGSISAFSAAATCHATGCHKHLVTTISFLHFLILSRTLIWLLWKSTYSSIFKNFSNFANITLDFHLLLHTKNINNMMALYDWILIIEFWVIFWMHQEDFVRIL